MTASEIKFAMFDGKLAWNRSSLVKKESEQESNSLVMPGETELKHEQ